MSEFIEGRLDELDIQISDMDYRMSAFREVVDALIDIVRETYPNTKYNHPLISKLNKALKREEGAF